MLSPGLKRLDRSGEKRNSLGEKVGFRRAGSIVVATLAAMLVTLVTIGMYPPPPFSTYVVEAQVDEGICDRTPQIRDAILDTLDSDPVCGGVTDAQLATITRFKPCSSDRPLTSLKVGDLDGLTGLDYLVAIAPTF